MIMISMIDCIHYTTEPKLFNDMVHVKEPLLQVEKYNPWRGRSEFLICLVLDLHLMLYNLHNVLFDTVHVKIINVLQIERMLKYFWYMCLN